MSREDSQFKLRMPADLREAIELAAKEEKRSLNAEIVARLELTALKQAIGSGLPLAAKARELSAAFRKSIPAEIKTRAVESINHAILHGLTSAHVELRDMELDSLPQGEADSLRGSLSEMFLDAGYEIEWDGLESLWVTFR